MRPSTINNKHTILYIRLYRAQVVMLTSRLNILLVLGLLAVMVDAMTESSRLVFPLALLGIVPLAERLG